MSPIIRRFSSPPFVDNVATSPTLLESPDVRLDPSSNTLTAPPPYGTQPDATPPGLTDVHMLSLPTPSPGISTPPPSLGLASFRTVPPGPQREIDDELGSDTLEARTRPDMPNSGYPWRGLRARKVLPLGDGTGKAGPFLVVSQGSSVDFDGDAIVNAANEGCLGSSGVDGQDVRQGGIALQDARQALPEVPGRPGIRCPTGESRITIGGCLNAKYCSHAVGPNFASEISRGQTIEACNLLLFNAYRTAMACAEGKGLETIAFSLLSAGIFRGQQSLQAVLHVAREAVAAGTYAGLHEVHLVGFTPEEVDALLEVCCEHVIPPDLATLCRETERGSERLEGIESPTLPTPSPRAAPLPAPVPNLAARTDSDFGAPTLIPSPTLPALHLSPLTQDLAHDNTPHGTANDETFSVGDVDTHFDDIATPTPTHSPLDSPRNDTIHPANAHKCLLVCVRPGPCQTLIGT